MVNATRKMFAGDLDFKQFFSTIFFLIIFFFACILYMANAYRVDVAIEAAMGEGEETQLKLGPRASIFGIVFWVMCWGRV